MAVVTHYSNNDETPAVDITVDFGREGTYEIYWVDKDHDGELVATTSELTFNMPVHSFILIKRNLFKVRTRLCYLISIP